MTGSIKKVGIYINAFDPVHSGDLTFAKDALEQTGLDKVYFFIEPRPKYKQGVKALEHRIHMVLLAVRNYPKFGSIVLKYPLTSRVELAKILNKRLFNQQMSVVIPDDNLSRLDTWSWLIPNKSSAELVIGLDRFNESEISHQVKAIESLTGKKINYSTFKTKSPIKLTNNIKRKLKLGVKPAEVADPVFDYINLEKLYSPSSKA